MPASQPAWGALFGALQQVQPAGKPSPKEAAGTIVWPTTYAEVRVTVKPSDMGMTVLPYFLARITSSLRYGRSAGGITTLPSFC